MHFRIRDSRAMSQIMGLIAATAWQISRRARLSVDLRLDSGYARSRCILLLMS